MDGEDDLVDTIADIIMGLARIEVPQDQAKEMADAIIDILPDHREEVLIALGIDEWMM